MCMEGRDVTVVMGMVVMMLQRVLSKQELLWPVERPKKWL
jgi:hypothetical protein